MQDCAFCLLVNAVRRCTMLRNVIDLGFLEYIEQTWIHTVNLGSSQPRQFNPFRAFWCFCLLSTGEHHPFKSQAEASQNLSNISSLSQKHLPTCLVWGEPSILFLILSVPFLNTQLNMCCHCRSKHHFNTYCFSDSKPSIADFGIHPWKLANS